MVNPVNVYMKSQSGKALHLVTLRMRLKPYEKCVFFHRGNGFNKHPNDACNDREVNSSMYVTHSAIYGHAHRDGYVDGEWVEGIKTDDRIYVAQFVYRR